MPDNDANSSSCAQEVAKVNSVEEKNITELPTNDRFEPDATFWSTWGGRIVRAVVLHDAYTKDSVLKSTNLKEEDFTRAVKGLIEDNVVEPASAENGKLWVRKEIYGKCKNFFRELQRNLASWVGEWREKEGIRRILGGELDHFYLAGRLLPEFSESLIKKAREEILITSPYVKRCNICDSLKLMSEKGVYAKLLTREIQFEQFRKELVKSVSVSYDESIHAKLIVVDRRVGIVSSMNFYAGSTAGQCWEAGIVTLDSDVVNSIYHSILTKISDSNPE